MKKQVLNKGFVEVIDSLGSDLTVVNSARVSFGKRKEVYDKSDRALVRFLAKHKHFSPFRHMVVQFHLKAPEFVMRQWYKHVVGIETTSSYPTKVMETVSSSTISSSNDCATGISLKNVIVIDIST